MAKYANIKWKYYGQFFCYFHYIFAILHTFSLSIFAAFGSVDNSELGNDTSISSNSSHQESNQVGSFGQVMRYIALSSNILLLSVLLTASIRLRFNFLNVQAVFFSPSASCYVPTLSTMFGLAALLAFLHGFYYLGH